VAFAIIAVGLFFASLASYSVVTAQVAPVSEPSTSVTPFAQDTAKYTFKNPDPSISYNKTETETTLTVVGLGYVNVPPDMISLNLGIDTISPTAQEAVKNNTQIMNKIIESLKALDLDEKEVKTSYFSVYPQYLYDPEGKNPPKITGYQASNNVNILSKETEKVAEIIDKSISAGANRIDGPNFSLSPEAQRSLRGEVIQKAIKDAEASAEEMLAIQNLSIKGIKSMSISFGGYPLAYIEQYAVSTSAQYGSNVMREAAMPQMSPAPYMSPPPILQGEQQISANVVVTYIVG